MNLGFAGLQPTGQYLGQPGQCFLRAAIEQTFGSDAGERCKIVADMTDTQPVQVEDEQGAVALYGAREVEFLRFAASGQCGEIKFQIHAFAR